MALSDATEKVKYGMKRWKGSYIDNCMFLLTLKNEMIYYWKNISNFIINKFWE